MATIALTTARSQGLAEAFHDRFVDTWNVAGDLVDRAFANGLLEREAERLHAAGRITVDPVAVAYAPGWRNEASVWVR